MPLDEESAQWLATLGAAGADHDRAVADLHSLLVRIGLAEVHRRAPRLRIAGPELDDIAHQAADDALVAIVAKLDQFRGDSRFTTWAYRFVILEVSAKLGRHWWTRPTVSLDAEEWDRLPDRLGVDPALEPERREMVSAVHEAVDAVLTPRQRQAFVAIVLNRVPVDAVVVQLGTNRNAVYKTLFDARRKVRMHLVAGGHLVRDAEEARGT